MKANELRIGNWVLYNDLYCKIIGIDKIGMDEDRVLVEYHNGETDYCYIDYIEPIELTEEVLVKIGFEKEKQLISIHFHLDCEIDVDNINYVKYVIYPNSLPLLKITTSQYENYECFEFLKRGIKYLHELQNAYYCLTNQELEIKL